MPYHTRGQVTVQHVQALITQLGFIDVTASHPHVPLAIKNNDGDETEHFDLYEVYRSLLQEIALRGVAP